MLKAWLVLMAFYLVIKFGPCFVRGIIKQDRGCEASITNPVDWFLDRLARIFFAQDIYEDFQASNLHNARGLILDYIDKINNITSTIGKYNRTTSIINTTDLPFQALIQLPDNITEYAFCVALAFSSVHKFANQTSVESSWIPYRSAISWRAYNTNVRYTNDEFSKAKERDQLLLKSIVETISSIRNTQMKWDNENKQASRYVPQIKRLIFQHWLHGNFVTSLPPHDVDNIVIEKVKDLEESLKQMDLMLRKQNVHFDTFIEWSNKHLDKSIKSGKATSLQKAHQDLRDLVAQVAYDYRPREFGGQFRKGDKTQKEGGVFKWFKDLWNRFW